MLNGKLVPSIISFAVPIILTGILQLLFNAADLVIVGQFCGSVSVAAVGATSSLTNLLVNFFMGLSIGSGVVVAHAIGARDDEAVHKAVHTALPIAILAGTVLTVVGVCFSGQFLIWMGTPENVLPLSTVYMQIYFAGMVFNLVYNFCASILRAAGDAKKPLIYLTLSGVFNVILNVVFVTLFNMNVAGVALATTISQALSAVLVVGALMHRTDACKLYLKKLRFYKAQLVKILYTGVPAGIQSSLFALSNVIIHSSINSFGDVVLSGSSAAGSIEGFIHTICVTGVGQTAINFVGQNYGAGQYRRIKKIFCTCILCALATSLICVVTYCFAPKLLSIYITDSPDAIQYGLIRMSYICVLYFVCGILEVITGTLRGLGMSLAPMLISVVGICAFRVLWIYTIFQTEKFHTLDCLFASYPISWVITLLAELAVLIIFYKTKIKNDEKVTFDETK